MFDEMRKLIGKSGTEMSRRKDLEEGTEEADTLGSPDSKWETGGGNIMRGTRQDSISLVQLI